MPDFKIPAPLAGHTPRGHKQNADVVTISIDTPLNYPFGPSFGDDYYMDMDDMDL